MPLLPHFVQSSYHRLVAPLKCCCGHSLPSLPAGPIPAPLPHTVHRYVSYFSPFDLFLLYFGQFPILIFKFYSISCVDFLCAYVPVNHVSGARGGQKDPLELGLQAVVSFRVGAWNRTPVL